MRRFLVASLLVCVWFATVWTRPDASVDDSRLAYVTTAHQLGVVGYRDPVGVVSRDGMRIAYAEGRHLYESPIAGGVRVQLAAAAAQIRYLASHGASPEWIFEDVATDERWWIVASGTPKRPFFGDRTEIRTAAGSATRALRINALRQLTVSADGKSMAALVNGAKGVELWRLSADGASATMLHGPGAISWPAFTSSGDVACVLNLGGRARLSVPCGRRATVLDPDVNMVGPLAFAPNAPHVFFAAGNDSGMVDLWRADLGTRKAERLTSFARDAYAPSISADGRVLFKVQSYRTSVAELDLESGRMQQLSTLQAETPSYHPDGTRIAVTYGTWRRVVDDAKYPDIAQDIGILKAMPVEAPASEPLEVIANSDSEDQAMTWSPNGKWIALHSHRELSDDIWLRPSAGGGVDRRVSFLGRGAEVGWPRWSPDGKWVLYNGASPSTREPALFVIGIDQESGAVTSEPRALTLASFAGEIGHGEWLPDSATIVAHAKEAAGRHAILSVAAAGGPVRVLHRYASEHDFPGLGVTADGGRIAFVAPASDGFYQLFALTMSGDVSQLTFDRTHKTQPAWSPDGRRLAYTVWSYEAQFWRVGR